MTVKSLRADHDGFIDGVRVIAIHGGLHPTETPARCGPVYVDDAYCLLRIVEVRPAPHGADVLVETAHPALPEEGALPGYATRLGPWPARLHHEVIVLGPTEIPRAAQMRRRSKLDEPEGVERFVRWLLTDRKRNEALRCEELEGAAVWYCSKLEGFALFARIHAVVEDEFFRAARRLREGRPDARLKLEQASWWLSRAATGDADIFRAAAGLERAGSKHWKLMLREGLQLRKDKDYTEGLADAYRLMDDPPATEEPAAVVGPGLMRDRESLRRLHMSPRPPVGASKKGTAAA